MYVCISNTHRYTHMYVYIYIVVTSTFQQSLVKSQDGFWCGPRNSNMGRFFSQDEKHDLLLFSVPGATTGSPKAGRAAWTD